MEIAGGTAGIVWTALEQEIFAQGRQMEIAVGTAGIFLDITVVGKFCPRKAKLELQEFFWTSLWWENFAQGMQMEIAVGTARFFSDITVVGKFCPRKAKGMELQNGAAAIDGKRNGEGRPTKKSSLLLELNSPGRCRGSKVKSNLGMEMKSIDSWNSK